MKWLQEYDIEFKPIHTIKGYGIFQFIIELIDSPKEDHSGWEQEIEMYNIEQVPPTSTTMPWYLYIQQ